LARSKSIAYFAAINVRRREVFGERR
jgi:hypothetical protein